MRRKPIEYNNEFITETIVLFYSETRITVHFLTLNIYDVGHAGLSSQKGDIVPSHHSRTLNIA